MDSKKIIPYGESYKVFENPIYQREYKGLPGSVPEISDSDSQLSFSDYLKEKDKDKKIEMLLNE